MRFFFYGTLRDLEVRDRVLGRRPLPGDLRAAELEGFTVRHAAGRSYPVLVARAGARAKGLLVSGLTSHEARCLDRFEGTTYRRVTRHVLLASGAHCEAEVYLPRAGLRGDARPWDFEAWRRLRKAEFLRQAFGGG